MKIDEIERIMRLFFKCFESCYLLLSEVEVKFNELTNIYSFNASLIVDTSSDGFETIGEILKALESLFRGVHVKIDSNYKDDVWWSKTVDVRIIFYIDKNKINEALGKLYKDYISVYMAERC